MARNQIKVGEGHAFELGYTEDNNNNKLEDR